MSTRSNIEEYPYEVIKEIGKVEVRKYDSSLFTSVNLSTKKYEEASSKGFSKLAGYIFGGNANKEKIAMTSPVAMSLGDSMEVMFMVPKKYKMEDLPKPDQNDIKFKEVPEKKMAAIQFGGWANDKKIEKYKDALKEVLEANDIVYTNRFFFHGFNPPYDMINRKNEILVELDDYES